MAVLVEDTVAREPCDRCPLTRVLGMEATNLFPRGIRVTVLDGCAECAGSTVVLSHGH